jgi:hypothetical protein
MTPRFKIEIVSNNIPICNTTPDSILRKITIIEFKSDKNKDNNLKEIKLKK